MGSYRGLPENLSSYQIIHYQAFQGLLYSTSWKCLRRVLSYIIYRTQVSSLGKAFGAIRQALRSYNLRQKTNLESNSQYIQINPIIRTHKQVDSW